MKRLIALLAVALACAAGAAAALPALAATKTVKVGPKFKFGPTKLTIHRGDTVLFRWTGGLPHNIVISKGPNKGAKIAGLKTKGTVRRRFTTPGKYTLLCQIHAPGMTLRLTVR